MDFRDKLIHELTQSDKRQSSKKGYNPYALGIYFQAVDEVMKLIKKGTSQENAFATCFNPTREMHKVAKALGFIVSVENGTWYFPNH